MMRSMNITLDWSAIAVEAACHENEPKKFQTILPEKILKQVQNDFLLQIKSSLDLLSYAGINLMRLRTFDAVPADVGDQVKDRLDNILNNAASKWNSVDTPKINPIKNTVAGNLQELLKDFLIKA
jgi:hypothetical protein